MPAVVNSNWHRMAGALRAEAYRINLTTSAFCLQREEVLAADSGGRQRRCSCVRRRQCGCC